MSQATEDTTGLLPPCCFRAHIDGRALGYVEGVTEGRRQAYDESWDLACEVVRGAAKSIDILAARRRSGWGQ